MQSQPVYVVNYFLAVLMIVIYVWSRSAPLPAMITGLGIYLAVVVLNAAVDPSSLRSGIVMKIIIGSMFYKGIRSAMEFRSSRLELADDSCRGTRRA